jgi:hypothetical protein
MITYAGRAATGQAGEGGEIERKWAIGSAITNLSLLPRHAPPCKFGLFPQCPVLAHLNLSGNLIRDKGAEILSGVLAQCPALAHLNLGENAIGPAGAEILAGVLAQCAALSHLDLSRNGIGADRASQSDTVLVLSFRGRESCKSAGAVHSAGAPQCQLQFFFRTSRDRESCRSAGTVPGSCSPRSQLQCDRSRRSREAGGLREQPIGVGRASCTEKSFLVSCQSFI